MKMKSKSKMFKKTKNKKLNKFKKIKIIFIQIMIFLMRNNRKKLILKQINQIKKMLEQKAKFL